MKHKEEIASTLETLVFHLEFDIGARRIELMKLSERQRTDKRKLSELHRLIAKLTRENKQ